MKQILPLYALLLVTVLGCQNEPAMQPNAVVKDIEQVTLAAQQLPQGITLAISFYDTTEPFKKGAGFLTKDGLSIVYSIRNLTDSTVFLDPPHFAPLGGNPSFSLTETISGLAVRMDDLTTVNFFPILCKALPARKQLVGTIDLLSWNSMNSLADRGILCGHTIPLPNVT